MASAVAQKATVEQVYFVNESWEKRVFQCYPELQWLSKPNVVMTQEGVAVDESSPSRVLFGEQFVEFDRTLLTIRCLHWIHEGNYVAFTEGQAEPNKLTLEAFNALNAQLTNLSQQLGISLEEIEVALVLGDLGKSREFRAQFPHITAPDHDDFEELLLKEMLQKPDVAERVLPSFAKLSQEKKNLLVHISALAHFGHIFHQEGGPEMFAKLAAIKDLTELELELALFIQQCDVAGAAGHVRYNGSLAFNMIAYSGYRAVAAACARALVPGASAKEIYTGALEERAKLCGFEAGEVLLTRLAAMMRLMTPEEGAVLRRVVEELDMARYEIPCPQLTATYIPAVLVNKMGATKGDLETKLRAAISWGLPKIIQGLSFVPGDGIRHCFNTLAGEARSGIDGEVFMDESGNISIIR